MQEQHSMSAPVVSTPAPAPAPTPMSVAPAAPPSGSPTPSKRWLWIALIGVVILAGAAYAWMALYPSTQVSEITPTPTMVVSPTATVDPTAGWKTYTNSQPVFTVQYPSDYRINPYGAPTGNEAVRFVQQGPEGTDLPMFSIWMFASPMMPGDWIKTDAAKAIIGDITYHRITTYPIGSRTITDATPTELGTHARVFSENGKIIVFADISGLTDPVPTAISTFKFTSSAAGPTIFENAYMRISIAAGWTALGTANSVNITNGNYILFINPVTCSAGGAVGGRSNDITAGAPGIDTVIKDPSSGATCSDEHKTTVGIFTRYDYIVNKATAASWGNSVCNAPTDGKSHWFFSYSTTGGYLGDVKKVSPGATASLPPANSNCGYAITMTYKAASVNALPIQTDPAFVAMLREMSDMVRGITFK